MQTFACITVQLIQWAEKCFQVEAFLKKISTTHLFCHNNTAQNRLEMTLMDLWCIALIMFTLISFPYKVTCVPNIPQSSSSKLCYISPNQTQTRKMTNHWSLHNLFVLRQAFWLFEGRIGWGSCRLVKQSLSSVLDITMFHVSLNRTRLLMLILPLADSRPEKGSSVLHYN